MARLGIGEVARKSGLRPSALRYYESKTLIPKAPIIGGRRVYDAEILDRLAVILLAKRAGFTLSEIRDLLRGPKRRKQPAAKRWQRFAVGKMAELDRRLQELTRMKRLLSALSACACPTLDDCGRALRRASD